VALVRREPVAAAGGFDETLSGMADWDLWVRLARAGVRWALVDRPLAEYRLRSDAMHQDTAHMPEDALRILAEVIDDPGLPATGRALRPAASQRACLTAACAHYRAGKRAAGNSRLRDAAEALPASLAEARTFRLFCRWLLPPERQCEAAVIAESPRLMASV